MAKNKIWKICMCGVLKCKDKVLVLKRPEDDEDMPGVWEFPSGNAEVGEDLHDALIREVWEETGVKLDKKNLNIVSLQQYESEKVDYIKCSVQINFVAELNEMPKVTLSEEHTAFKWVTRDAEEIDEFLNEILVEVE